MADFSFHLFTEPWDEFQREVQVASDKATVAGMRAVGARVAARARAAAPVYHGDDPRALAESGNLRKSITPGRTTTIGGGTYEMKVMPKGSQKKGTAVVRHGHHAARASTLVKRRAAGNNSTSSGEVRGVPLYRRKMEERYGYMASGTDAGMSAAVELYEAAYRKAFLKWGPG